MALTNISTGIASNGQGTGVAVNGGLLVFRASGTFGGGTLGVDVSYDGGTTWDATGLTFTATGVKFLQGPAAMYRYNLSGATSPTLALAYGIQDQSAVKTEMDFLYNYYLGRGVPGAQSAVTT